MLGYPKKVSLAQIASLQVRPVGSAWKSIMLL